VPSTGDSPEEIANHMYEHTRHNHRDSLETLSFFIKLLRPFVVDGIISAKQLHAVIGTSLEPFPIISGMPTIEGQECVQCGYCGPEATVARHLHNHASPTIPQTLQQIEVNGAYVVVRKPDQFQYKTDAWKALHNIMLDTHSTDLSGQNTESAFVKNTGWMGCVEGQITRCEKMTNLDDDDLGPDILQQVQSHLDLINESLKSANITLRRWLSSNTYSPLSIFVLRIVPP